MKIDKNTDLALRGIGILAIMLHNYCHWLGFAVKENEYTFTASKVNQLIAVTAQPDSFLPIHLLSFFGHYGVPIFLLLSGYGLVCRYESISHDVAPLPFVRYHYLKLFRMMIGGFALFTMIDAITPALHRYQPLHIIAQLALINNILPNPDHIIWPGPYWFFGLMLQFYILYRIVLYRRSGYVVMGLIVVCHLLQAFCDAEGETLNRLRYNFIGGMLPFGCGILLARYGKTFPNISPLLLLFIATLGIIAFSLSFQLWFWVPLFVCIAAISLVKTCRLTTFSPLLWIGKISASLFVTHPVVREIFIRHYRHDNYYAGILLYFISSLFVAWLFDMILARIPKPHLH